MTQVKMSRLEIDIRRLLMKCEEMAKEDDRNTNWRLPTFIKCVDEMITDLKNAPMKPAKEEFEKYVKQVTFLKELLRAEKENAIQKSIAVQKLAPPSALNNTYAKEIYQKNLANCENNLRKELLNDTSELRHRMTTFEISGSQEFDSILKYHNGKHEQIATDMLNMTRSMKEQSELAGKIIREDTKVLEKSSKLMDDNYGHLQKQSNRLQDFISKSGWQCWIWIMLAAMIIIFINMVFFMKISKKSY